MSNTYAVRDIWSVLTEIRQVWAVSVDWKKILSHLPLFKCCAGVLIPFRTVQKVVMKVVLFFFCLLFFSSSFYLFWKPIPSFWSFHYLHLGANRMLTLPFARSLNKDTKRIHLRRSDYLDWTQWFKCRVHQQTKQN